MGPALLRRSLIEELPYCLGIAIPGPVQHRSGGSAADAMPKSFVDMKPLEELSERVRVIRISEDEAIDFIAD